MNSSPMSSSVFSSGIIEKVSTNEASLLILSVHLLTPTLLVVNLWTTVLNSRPEFTAVPLTDKILASLRTPNLGLPTGGTWL